MVSKLQKNTLAIDRQLKLFYQINSYTYIILLLYGLENFELMMYDNVKSFLFDEL